MLKSATQITISRLDNGTAEIGNTIGRTDNGTAEIWFSSQHFFFWFFPCVKNDGLIDVLRANFQLLVSKNWP